MNSITCRYCQSKNVISYGHIHNGKKRYMCHDCHRQFTPSAQKKYISKEQREMVDKMLLERISIAAISRVTGISKSWLYRYIKHVVAYTAESLDVEPNKDGELELECDEVWSFVGSKQNPQWLWLALEKTTRLIVAACIGDRSIETAKKLWRRLPRVWRNQAKFYTDFWQAYR